MKPLPSNYNHKTTEERLQKLWADMQVYAWDENESRENSYVIDTPPPTVSGLLHMGHVFSYTQADFIARYQRMSGKNVFYPMGFDDNGLPTERLVEKVKKVRATDMSREEFIELCESVAEEARGEFRKLFEEIALSVDWKQEYHTISNDSRKISQLSFLDLYNKKKAYRKLQPMLWDPVDQTAIAQAEIEDKEMQSQKNYLYFGMQDEQTGENLGKLQIMTTRPELLSACVAVICHPDDVKKYHGKVAITPVFGVKVPIIADLKVDKEKGTGLVMCCTFGDETDIAWWRDLNLPTRLILNKYGKISPANIFEENGNFIKLEFYQTEDGSEKYGKLGRGPWDKDNTIDLNKAISAYKQIENMKCRSNARVRMLELLAEDNAIFKDPEITTHAEPCAERSGSPLEILPTNQWFIKILDQKEQLKEKAAQCNWYPQFMKVRIDQWIEGLSWDWCISRQRYFGVPFPIWYVKDLLSGEEKTVAARAEDLPVNPLVDIPFGYKFVSKNADGSFNAKNEQLNDVIIVPETDVMDTWATSSVSPQLSSYGINNELFVDQSRHAKLFPADLRPQAHEIIRTWAFYTIVKAHLHENTIPWKNLMISGWCLASDKTKMSKSKGNVVTPVSLIEEKGSDVVRFWASTSRLGADTAYSEDVLKIGNKLINKLFNATKFSAIHLEKLDLIPQTAMLDVVNKVIYEPLDIWILSKLKNAVKISTQEFERYEYCNARAAAEDFFWNDFCDNYLEFIKVRVYGEVGGITKAAQMSAVHTIYHCLDGILRLFAPIIPHVTEELYAHIFDHKIKQLGGSIHCRGSWLNAEDYPYDEIVQDAGTQCISILEAVRKIKAEKNVSIKTPLKLLSISGDGAEKKLSPLSFDLKNVTNAENIVFIEQSEDDNNKATAMAENGYKVTVEFVG